MTTHKQPSVTTDGVVEKVDNAIEEKFVSVSEQFEMLM